MARQIPQSVISDYVSGINALSKHMRDALSYQLSLVDFTDFNAAKARVMELMQLYCGTSTYATGLVGAEFYRIARQYIIDVEDGYEPTTLTGRVPEATDEAVRAILQKEVEGKHDEFLRELIARLDFEIRRASMDNTAINAKLDPKKPLLQRVAQGSETCDFCLMLCSREPSRYTVEHVHANCDCKLVPVTGRDSIQDYDWTAAYDRWQDALTAKAEDRAARHGTTVEEEKRAIIRTYENSARRNKQNARVRIQD